MILPEEVLLKISLCACQRTYKDHGVKDTLWAFLHSLKKYPRVSWRLLDLRNKYRHEILPGCLPPPHRSRRRKKPRVAVAKNRRDEFLHIYTRERRWSQHRFSHTGISRDYDRSHPPECICKGCCADYTHRVVLPLDELALTFFSCHQSGLIFEWHIYHNEPIRCFSGHYGSCPSVVCSREYLVSGSADHDVRVWSRVSGDMIHVLRHHTGAVACLSLEGNLVASGSMDHTACLWEYESGRLVHTFQLADWVWLVQLDLETERLYTACDDGVIQVWDIVSGNGLHTLDNGANPTCFHAVGDLLACACLVGGARLWHVPSGKVLFEGAPPFGLGSFMSIHFVPPLLAVAGEGCVVVYYLPRLCTDRQSGEYLDQGGAAPCVDLDCDRLLPRGKMVLWHRLNEESGGVPTVRLFGDTLMYSFASSWYFCSIDQDACLSSPNVPGAPFRIKGHDLGDRVTTAAYSNHKTESLLVYGTESGRVGWVVV